MIVFKDVENVNLLKLNSEAEKVMKCVKHNGYGDSLMEDLEYTFPNGANEYTISNYVAHEVPLSHPDWLN